MTSSNGSRNSPAPSPEPGPNNSPSAHPYLTGGVARRSTISIEPSGRADRLALSQREKGEKGEKGDQSKRRRSANGHGERAAELRQHRNHGARQSFDLRSAGFCGTSASHVWRLANETDESIIPIRIINMVEKCPSGALTYSLGDEQEVNEQTLPTQASVLPDGPLCLTG